MGTKTSKLLREQKQAISHMALDSYKKYKTYQLQNLLMGNFGQHVARRSAWSLFFLQVTQRCTWGLKYV